MNFKREFTGTAGNAIEIAIELRRQELQTLMERNYRTQGNGYVETLIKDLGVRVSEDGSDVAVRDDFTLETIVNMNQVKQLLKDYPICELYKENLSNLVFDTEDMKLYLDILDKNNLLKNERVLILYTDDQIKSFADSLDYYIRSNTTATIERVCDLSKFENLISPDMPRPLIDHIFDNDITNVNQISITTLDEIIDTLEYRIDMYSRSEDVGIPLDIEASSSEMIRWAEEDIRGLQAIKENLSSQQKFVEPQIPKRLEVFRNRGYIDKSIEMKM